VVVWNFWKSTVGIDSKTFWLGLPWNLSTKLVGGFKHFLFSLYFGKIFILTNIFQLGWNHQPEKGLLAEPMALRLMYPPRCTNPCWKNKRTLLSFFLAWISLTRLPHTFLVWGQGMNRSIHLGNERYLSLDFPATCFFHHLAIAWIQLLDTIWNIYIIIISMITCHVFTWSLSIDLHFVFCTFDKRLLSIPGFV